MTTTLSILNPKPAAGGPPVERPNRDSVVPAQAARRLLGASLLFVLPPLLVFAMPGAGEWLQYDRRAIVAGQVWRLLTCHWTHWSANHLFWDTLMFVSLAVGCLCVCRHRMAPCIAASALLIGATVFVAAPAMATYRGLSGIDSALFLLLALALIRQPGSKLRGVMALAIVLFLQKLAYELITGRCLFVNDPGGGMKPLPLAHAVGAVVGAMMACLPRATRTFRTSHAIGRWTALGALALLATGASGCTTITTRDMSGVAPALRDARRLEGTYRNQCGEPGWTRTLWAALTDDSAAQSKPADRVRIEVAENGSLSATLVVAGEDRKRVGIETQLHDGYLLGDKTSVQVLVFIVGVTHHSVGLGLDSNGDLVVIAVSQHWVVFPPCGGNNGTPVADVFARDRTGRGHF